MTRSHASAARSWPGSTGRTRRRARPQPSARSRARGASVGSPRGPCPRARESPAELGIRLRARDRACLDRLVRISPIALSPAIWGAVAAAYTAPGRYYHTLEHLAELAASWEAVAAGPGWRDPRASWLALLFHDAVYDVAAGPGVSETRSAALLAALLPETAEPERLIRLTAAHGHEPPDLDADAAHFLDADMAILGAPPARFARYEAQVAAEYAPVVGMDAFRAGRRAFLSGLAAKPRIFGTPFFHDRLDAPARANLARALA